MKQTKDEVMPPERGASWEFDRSVTEAFSDMLQRSVPQYDVMRETVAEIAWGFLGGEKGSFVDGHIASSGAIKGSPVPRRGTLLDLGCSRGDAIARVMDRCGEEVLYVGCEVSKPMLMACRDRFKESLKKDIVKILDMDLRKEFPPVISTVTQSILTMMFIPIEYRMKICSQVYGHMVPGGAFIVVEKVLGETADIDSMMVDQYLKMKREKGYTDDQIDRKKLSLEGVLVPVTAKWNENLLRSAGFRQVDCFWRWMNFAAWVAIK